MSSFQEIKGLFTNEIINSHQYQLGLKIKDLLIADIQAPKINYSFIYEFQPEDYQDINNKEYEENITVLALKLILGFEVEHIEGGIVIVMKKFLD
jgi:hypothetical protein